MNATQRGILIGMLWGDGCIKHKIHTKKSGEKSDYYEFVIGHSSIQKEYIEYKRDVFHSMMGGKRPNICSREFKLAGKTHTELRFGKQHNYFSTLYRWVYPYGKKTYTRKALDMVSAAGLAFWYMDDGGLSKAKRGDGTISSASMTLATYCSSDEMDVLCSYFDEVWGLKVSRRHHKKTGRWYIAFNTENSKKLELIIKPFMHSSMLYKLPSTWVTRVRDTPLQ